jgi:hypothetical protein
MTPSVAQLACACLSLVTLVTAPCYGQFSAGAGKKSIQPTLPVPISGGMGAPKMATQARGELTARAVAVSDGKTTIAICCVDLLGFPAVLCDRVRAKVTGVPVENIMIGSTHTHSAPDCYAFPDGKGGHTADLKYVDTVVEQTAAAIQAAVNSLKPASLKTGSGVAQGKIAFNYYAPALYDQRMGVLQAVDKEGKTIFTLVNYAIHPEVLGNERGIVSPDAIGPLYDKLEADHGGLGMFMNGAQGGMVTADNRVLDKLRDPNNAVWEGEGSWEECQRIGQLMAAEAGRIIAAAEAQTAPKLQCEMRRVNFPIDSDILWQVYTLSPLGHSANRQEREISIPINLINLGDSQIATIPGEALPNIGFYLKRKMQGKHQFLFGLTNDAFGYILTKVDFQSFPRYDYVSRVCLGEMTGEILIENILDMVEKTRGP